jgi:FlaA1/EpsC-like NDP-sugar epimerase
MGSPIRILDLASDLIQLSGLRPNHDIEIVFTGLKPGEKLHEELVLAEELLSPTEVPGVSVVQSSWADRETITGIIAELEAAVANPAAVWSAKWLVELAQRKGEAAYAALSANGHRAASTTKRRL